MNTQTKQLENNDYTATYSPEDNKIRLYCADRLDKDLYNRVKSAGFRWAPKQDLFFAFWSPKAEDITLELAGLIGDEDTSLVERSEIRAERFEGYQENRANDAQSAYDGVQAIKDNIPLGQPILVGHHSEKKARKDAEKIERGLKKAVSMWETSEYWAYRAKGAIRSAKYKERADVRARRIKKLEAETRKYNKIIDEHKAVLKMWSSDKLDHEKAVLICNYYDHQSACFTLDKFPRNPPTSQYEGAMSFWGALNDGILTFEQARDIKLKSKPRSIAYYQRLVDHNGNRLSYEKAMLDDQGGSDLLKPKARPAQLPLLNYKTDSLIRTKNPQYYAKEYTEYKQVSMTKAEYKAIPKDYKGGAKIQGTHRIKIAMGAFLNLETNETGIDRTNRDHSYYAVFLTDSKIHEQPTIIEGEE